MNITDKDLPGLYQVTDRASILAQRAFFLGLMSYLVLLVFAAGVPFIFTSSNTGAIFSLILFLFTLAILIWLRAKRPDDIWYNGRAVAESVKTRSWRWMMRAEPYQETELLDVVSKHFINDLKVILDQNRSISSALGNKYGIKDPISNCMYSVRALSIKDRLEIYKSQRVQDQAEWYARKAIFNRNKSWQWFWASVILHASAILMLILLIKNPNLSFPIGVVSTAASSVLTWLQAKKHNELASSYSLAAHETVLIKGEALSIDTENDLSNYVVNSEAAFSREHTQWAARKNV